MPRVFVITGPSGVGKGTLIKLLRERVPELELSVSATTRDPRPGRAGRRRLPLPQRRGVRAARRRRRRSSSTPSYSGRRYGTLRSELERRTSDGHPVVLEIEVQGARQVRETLPEAVQIFIAPPSARRAARRASSAAAPSRPSRSRRACDVAEDELEAAARVRARVVNDRLEDAVERLVAIVRARAGPDGRRHARRYTGT